MHPDEAWAIGCWEFERGWTEAGRGLEKGSGDGGFEELKKWVWMVLDSQADEQWRQWQRRR